MKLSGFSRYTTKYLQVVYLFFYIGDLRSGQFRDLPTGLDLSFAGNQGEYHCMWRCPRPGLNPSGLVNNSSLAAGPQFTEMKIL